MEMPHMNKKIAIFALASLLAAPVFAETGSTDPTMPGPGMNSNDVTPGADSGSSMNNSKGAKTTTPDGMNNSTGTHTGPDTMDHGTHREHGSNTGTGAGMGMDSSPNGSGAGSTPGMGPATDSDNNP
jgi:hypothetical protein